MSRYEINSRENFLAFVAYRLGWLRAQESEPGSELGEAMDRVSVASDILSHMIVWKRTEAYRDFSVQLPLLDEDLIFIKENWELEATDQVVSFPLNRNTSYYTGVSRTFLGIVLHYAHVV